jgi:membrane protease YdiL (CAAX protease family)
VTSIAHAAAPPVAACLRLALPVGLIAALALAEVLAALGAVDAALAIDVALVLALVNGVLFVRSHARAKLLCLLALVPLTRPLGMAMSFDGAPREYWPALAGVPLLAAVVWASRTVGFPLANLLPASRRGAQLAALGGPILGIGAYLLAGTPEPDVGVPGLVLAAVGLVLAVALQQEILFRGLLQRLLTEHYGPSTLALVALNGLFAATLYGTTLAFALYMGAVGMAFSTIVRRDGALGEVVIAHAGLSVFGLLVFPLLLG